MDNYDQFNITNNIIQTEKSFIIDNLKPEKETVIIFINFTPNINILQLTQSILSSSSFNSLGPGKSQKRRIKSGNLRPKKTHEIKAQHTTTTMNNNIKNQIRINRLKEDNNILYMNIKI